MGYDRDELSRIKQALAQDAAALGEYLFGKPSSRSRKEIRWGSKGSRVITLSGRHRGRYYDHEAKRGGSMLDAIQDGLGLTFKDALDWAKQWLGISEDQQGQALAMFRQTAPAPVIEDANPDEQERIAQVQQIWAEAVSVSGTLAETYLWNRSIRTEMWPETIRWHPGIKALIAASYTPDGQHTAIGRIYINADGTPRLGEGGKKIKPSLGPRYGGAVQFAGDASGPVVICEGVETALAVWYATGHETWAALGLVSGVALDAVPHDRTVILCPDDDARDAKTIKPVKDAIRSWREQGRFILTAHPWDTLRRDKTDMNDALAEQGAGHVRKRLEAAQEPLGYERQSHALPVDAARTRLSRVMTQATDRLWHERAELPQLGIRVDVGTGKTEQAISSAVSWIKLGRNETDEGKPAPVVLAVPTHHLGRELVDRIKGEAARQQRPDIRVATWRGREADNPDDQDETGKAQPMCRNLEAVRIAQEVMADVQQDVCSSENVQCPHFSRCAYQRQREAKADIWVVTHASLFHERPNAIGTPSLLIIDESPWQAAMRGLDVKPMHIGLASLERLPTAWKDGERNDYKTADLEATLVPTRRKLLEAIADSNLGPIQRSALIEAGLTADECHQAAGAEWHRKMDAGIRPGMSLETMKARSAKALQSNADISRLSRLFRELETFLLGDADASGRISIETSRDEVTGAESKVLSLRWVAGMQGGWQAPVLHIDATLRPDIMGHLLPRLEMVADISVHAPHQQVVASIGKSYSHAALKSDKAVDRLWQRIRHKAVLEGGRTLVILPKRAEESIRQRYDVPPYVALAHHGNIAGLDEFKDVSLLIVVGRNLPAPIAVERIAGALTGQAVETLVGRGEGSKGNAGDWYLSRPVTVTGRQSGQATMLLEQHPDSLVDEIRQAICDDQLIQAIGRARGVNRSTDDPVRVELWGETVVPVPADYIVPHYEPTKDEQALAAGLWAASAADLARIYPEAGAAGAIKGARQRLGTFPYKSTYTKMYPTSGNGGHPAVEASIQQLVEASPHLRLALYQRAGSGMKPQIVLYDPRQVQDVGAALVEALGPLKILPEVVLPCQKLAEKAIPAVDVSAERELQRAAAAERAAIPAKAQEESAEPVVVVLHSPTTGQIRYQMRSGGPVPSPDVWEAFRSYASGVMPDPVRSALRGLRRVTGMRQEDMAAVLGISRPQLANAEQGRFGLGAEVVERVKVLIFNPPPARQASLFE